MTSDATLATPLVTSLNRALATEVVATMRGRRYHGLRHHFDAEALGNTFFDHANVALANADRLAERIVALAGDPIFDLTGIGKRAFHPYRTPDQLIELLSESQAALEASITAYTELIAAYAEDTATAELLTAIITADTAQIAELAALLVVFTPPEVVPPPVVETPTYASEEQGSASVHGGRMH